MYTEHDKDMVARDLRTGRAQIINRHSTCCLELTWLGPEEANWLGDEHTGCWSADTGFVMRVEDDTDPEPARDIHYHVGGTANCPACADYADYLADQEKDG